MHRSHPNVTGRKSAPAHTAGRLLTTEEVADELRVSVSALTKWRIIGKGPTFVKIGSRVGYTRQAIDEFVSANYSSCAEDLDGDKVFMARNQFTLDYTRERAPGIVFTDIKDVKKA